MINTISTAEARKKLSEMINKVAYGYESYVLTRRGDRIAALISIEELELLQKIEDIIDIRDAEKALSDSGDNILEDQFWEKLGI